MCVRAKQTRELVFRTFSMCVVAFTLTFNSGTHPIGIRKFSIALAILVAFFVEYHYKKTLIHTNW